MPTTSRIYRYRNTPINSKLNLSFYTLFCVVMFSLAVLPYNRTATTQTELMPIQLEPPKPEHKDIAGYIQHVNKALSYQEALDLAKYVSEAADAFKIPKALFLAVIKSESGFNTFAESPHGALGLTQIIPEWHQDHIDIAQKLFNRDSVFDPQVNLYVGAWAFHDFFVSAGHDVEVALLKYNGSPLDGLKEYSTAVMADAENIKRYLAEHKRRKTS